MSVSCRILAHSLLPVALTSGLCQEPLSPGARATETLCSGLCRFTLTTVATQGSTHQTALLNI